MPSLRTRCLVAATALVAGPVLSVAEERPPVTLDEFVAPLSVDLANALQKQGIRSVEIDALERMSFETAAHERLRRTFVRLLGRAVTVRETGADAVLRLYTNRRQGRYECLCLVNRTDGHTLGRFRFTWRDGDPWDRAVLQGATFDASVDSEGRRLTPTLAGVRQALGREPSGFVDRHDATCLRAAEESRFAVQLVPGVESGKLVLDPRWKTFDLPRNTGFRVMLHNGSNRPVAVALSVDGVNVWDGPGRWSDGPGGSTSFEHHTRPRRTILVEARRRVLVSGWPEGNLQRNEFREFGTRLGNQPGTFGQVTAVFFPVDTKPQPVVEPTSVARLRGSRVDLVSRCVGPVPSAAITARFARPGVPLRESYTPTSTTIPTPVELATIDDVPPRPPDSGRGYEVNYGSVKGVVKLGFAPQPPPVLALDPPEVRPPRPPTPLERLDALAGTSNYGESEARFLRRCLVGDDETLSRRAMTIAVVEAKEQDTLAVVLPVFDAGSEAEKLRLLRMLDDPLHLVLSNERLAERIAKLGEAEDPLLRATALAVQPHVASRREPVVEPLTRLLSAENADVRRTAAEGLGRCGQHAGSAVPRLLELLNDTDPTVTSAAVDAIRRITMQ